MGVFIPDPYYLIFSALSNIEPCSGALGISGYTYFNTEDATSARHARPHTRRIQSTGMTAGGAKMVTCYMLLVSNNIARLCLLCLENDSQAEA